MTSFAQYPNILSPLWIFFNKDNAIYSCALITVGPSPSIPRNVSMHLSPERTLAQSG